MSNQGISSGRATAVARLKTLTNQELKDICRAETLAVSGVKANLQGRIIEQMDRAISNNDLVMFERVRYRIHNKGAAPPAHYPGPAYGSSASPVSGYPSMNHASLAHGTNGSMSHAYSRPSLPPPSGQRSGSIPHRLAFRQSPFYHIQEAITPVQDLAEMPHNRHQITYPIALSEHVTQRLRENPDLRVMLYCTASTLMSYEHCDISFPSQLDVRINSDEVKHNYKGLKNKPGTTKPVDLTRYLRKQPKYPNQMQINYALTSKKYSWVINLVRKSSAEELTEKVRNGRVISKDRVLQEMRAKAKDPDIIATSIVMSLKDPISTMRMELPCRSTICSHNQCFDVSSFIQLQEQAPTWACPICNKTISFEGLAVDHYVLDILQKTPKSVDQVKVEPEGEWQEIKQDDGGDRNGDQSHDEDSDEDLVEIVPPGGGVPIKKDPTASVTPGVAQHTPPLSSREPSAPQMSASRQTKSGAQKRTSAVIDLTLSDDEDDDPPRRPHKRPAAINSYNTPASMQDSRISFPGLQHRPSASSPFQIQFPTTSMLSSPANGGAPQVPPSESNGQTLPWPQSYASYPSPWRVHQQDRFGGSQGPR
ncbi:hypothetical protein CAC42_5162 [Sphaceloma murrayae]|uniref:E3 SUMO-protein ligase pli1 n=1 Tax=Sphaceloma murrayae TaxID=2082308 RepID=A0A2K1QUR8_9PEZI|nr:hypothetical protein CAC42_5162 [Sphaceloma murrayae]